MKRTFSRQNKAAIVFRMELRHFFLTPENLKFLLLLPAGVFVALWPYVGSPLLPVFLIVLAGLEPQFNNILYRAPLEFEALSTLPVDWGDVVTGKNAAAAALMLLLTILVAVVTMYFSPRPLTAGEAVDGALYYATVIFPLLHAGNVRSVQRPRRSTGLGLNDIAEAIVMLVIAGILSIPYFIALSIARSRLLCLLIALAGGVFWMWVSVPRTAVRISEEKLRICQTV